MPNDIHFDIIGDGEPLLLIPGFASGAWNWFCQTDALSRRFRVITFDPRGIGRSKIAAENAPKLTLRAFADDAISILDRAGIAKANVLGASFGGFVAQEIALRHPERIHKLVLCCTTAGGARHIAPTPEILKSFAPDPLMELGQRIRRFIRPAFSDDFNRDHADVVEQVCRLREENTVADATYMAQLQAAFLFNSEDQLASVSHETLVITGSADRIVPACNSDLLAAKIPRARLEIVENGSHLFFIENADEFNRRVASFIDGEH